MDLDADIDRLFGLDPDDFVAERDALAKRLRAEKRRDDAAEVKALRRPTVVAWAVNQLARRRRDAIEELLARGETLRGAQESALRGDAGPLREATAERRRSVERLRKAAAALLEERGSPPSDASLDQVSATLEAATVDPEAARVVRAGRLSKELPAPSGFGGLSLDDALAASVDDDRSQRRRAEELAAAASAARQRAVEARRHADGAAEEVARLERELADARLGAEDAAVAADAAEAEAAAAEREAESEARPGAQ